MQRILDILFSFISIVFLLPIFLVTLIVLRFTGEKEVFYIQKRIGKNGNEFGLIKFATMLKNSPNLKNGTITIQNDPRVLPVGIYLRKTKINELPQLINIIKGDMSIIGPRPLTPENFNMYPENIKNTIINCRPGLSGIGSIVFRNEEIILSKNVDASNTYKNLISPYKGELEVWYRNNSNIFSYFKLIFLTIVVIFYSKPDLIFRFFNDLPMPNNELKKLLNIRIEKY